MIGGAVLLLVLAGLGVAVILLEPSAARTAADLIERRAAAVVSVLRAHAEARAAAKTTYKRVYRFCRSKVS